ncbi:MAG: LytTR family DNA-binding domain-containing protein [Acidobacteriota bacterium]
MQPTAPYFAVAGCALALALTLLDPDSSSGLGFAPRLVYWLAHVGGALTLLVALQRLLRPRAPQVTARAAGRIVLAGLLGSAIFLPVARLLESFFFDAPASGILEEAVEVVPQVLAFWLLLNLPFLLRLGRPVERPQSQASEGQVSPSGESAPGDGSDPLAKAAASSTLEALNLPPQLGDRIVAISTELHYLRVYTALGNALVLGSLSQLEASGDLPDGLRIHRSHWVATQTVRRLVKREGVLVCLLENGLELPISRRRAKAAREAFEGVALGTLERPERPRPS